MTFTDVLRHIRTGNWIQVPSGIYISPHNFPDENGNPRTNISWYDTKLITKQYGLTLPTSNEWGDARKHAQKHDPETERLFISGPINLTDSMIAFPKNSQYPKEAEDILKSLLGTKPSRYPILIEGTDVEKHKNEYSILKTDKTTAIELPSLPLTEGYIQEWDDNLDLPTKAGPNPNPEYHGAYFWVNPNGITPVLRGGWYWAPHGDGRFGVSASWRPSDSDPDVASRPAAKEHPAKILGELTSLYQDASIESE